MASTDIPKPDQRNAVVASKYVAMLAPFISKDEVRYYLNGIYIEPHREQGVLMVATDGHYMGVVHDKEGTSNGSWICPVPANILKACRYQPRRKGRISEQAAKVHFLGTSAVVTNGQFAGDNPLDMDGGIPLGVMAMERAQAIDGTYPDWRRIIPKSKPRTSIHEPLAYNPRLLGNFQSVLAAAGAPDKHTCVVFPGKMGDASVVRFEHIPEFFALLMSMHASALPSAIPGWISAERPPGGKKAKKSPARKAA